MSTVNSGDIVSIAVAICITVTVCFIAITVKDCDTNKSANRIECLESGIDPKTCCENFHNTMEGCEKSEE